MGSHSNDRSVLLQDLDVTVPLSRGLRILALVSMNWKNVPNQPG